jgi:hypothetical protein
MRGVRAALVALGLLAAGAAAEEADVVQARAVPTGEGVYRFQVTVRHADAGWDHYADRWEILAPDGRILATRVLRHPHLDEQPFTRALAGVEIPPELEQVTLRAHDSVHGYGGASVTVSLPRSAPEPPAEVEPNRPARAPAAGASPEPGADEAP